MKILIVDDNDIRLARVIDHLMKDGGISRDAIHTATTGLEARHCLKASHYDLLIIDLVLRQRPESEPDVQTSQALLVELTETDALHRPGQIIGITAYADAKEAAIQFFERYSWCVLRTDEVNNAYLPVLAASVRYLVGRENNTHSAPAPVDVLVVAALESEMAAFQRGWTWESDEPFDDANYYARGQFLSKGRSTSVAAATALRMGMVSAAVLSAKLIQALRPKIVVMPGICAGVHGKTDLGDVIFADACWDYQSGKHTGGANASGFAMDPHFLTAEPALMSRWDLLARDAMKIQDLTMTWQGERRAPPRLRRGPVGSGSAVLADDAIVQEILKQQRKTLAIEMELYGVFCAAASASWPRPLVCGIKAVCDFADASKNDDIQGFAAHMSGAVGREFLERYAADFCPPVS